MAALKIQASSDTLTFPVKVIPRSRRDEIVGVEGDALKVRLKAPPVEGKANEALVRFLASVLGIPKRNVEIVRGESARRKIIRVRNLPEDRLKEVLKL